MPKKTGEALLRFVFRESYDFLMGISDTGEVFRNFQFVEVPEEKGEKGEDMALEG